MFSIYTRTNILFFYKNFINKLEILFYTFEISHTKVLYFCFFKTNVCKEIYEFGKNQKDLRQKEVDEFWKCLIEAKNLNTDEATNSINVFTEWKKNVFNNEKIF